MAITTVDGIIGGSKQKLIWNKAGMSNVAAAGMYVSGWNMTGQPGAGTLSVGNTTAGVTFLDSTPTGCPLFSNPVSGNSYISKVWLSASQIGTWILFDRIWGAGALTPTNGAYTSLASGTLSASRIGSGSDVELWAENVTTLGAATYAQTIVYVDADDASQNATLTLTQTAAPAMLPFLMPGRGLKSVSSGSGNTNGTGTFNVLALRRLAEVNIDVINRGVSLDFAAVGFPRVYDDSALFWVWLATGTSEPTFVATVDLVQG